MYFGKFVMTFINTGEIGGMSIHKCHWVVIVVNLVKLYFLHDVACWCGFVYAGSISSIPASRASWHACYKALHAFYRDFCPFIQQGLAELTKILGQVVHTGDCTAQFIPHMFYGLQSGDLAGSSILVMLPC